ncbi:MAG: hypothetical protein N3A54_03030 [Patescibacteria group bacterium]|nr:hypothetical protein [Patescibacteria group bacterium]
MKIDLRIFYTAVQDKIIHIIQKVLRTLPYTIYSEALSTIFIGPNKFVPATDASIFYKNTIFISQHFLTTDSPLATLQKILVHEIGHAFILGWKENLFLKTSIKQEYMQFLEKVIDKVPEAKKVLVNPASEKQQQKIEKFINDFGAGELKVKLFPLIRSPYAIVSIEEFIAYNFEEFFLGEPNRVRNACPSLFSMLTNIMEKNQ